MPSSKDLAQRPRRRWEPFICALRLKFVPQRPGNKMRRGSQRIVDHAPQRMQQELLRRIRADDVHTYRRGQHASRMEEQVQMRATLDSQTQCASQDAPADG